MDTQVRPRTQQSRNNRKASIKRRRKQELIHKTILFIILITVVVGGAILIKKLGSSKEKVDLNKYYGIENENQLAVIVDEEIVGAKGMLFGDRPYVEYAVVRDYLNDRFYVDMNENLLLYTLPEGTIRAEVGSEKYLFQKESKQEEYALLKMEGHSAYIALEFVQKYTNLEFSVYEKPGRIVIVSKWGEKNVATVKKTTPIRKKAGKKNPILTSVSKKDNVTVLGEESNWKLICTEDGFVGYIKGSCLKQERTETFLRDFKEPEYPCISKDYTINMAWHVVANGTANNTVLETIANTKGLTTISPTWFMVKDTKGGLTSLASSQYVNYAHQSNIEVWAMVKDFDGGISSREETFELLSRTTSREKLINQIISEALRYNIDGINVDFENVSQECGEHYIQFIRELSLKCRQNGIIISVDTPVPGTYSTQYHREELGKYADYVIIMGYDEHHRGSYESGSVASIPFVKKGIEDALTEVPAQKLINAVPFYTRLWKEVPKTEEELDAEEGTDAAEYPDKVTSQAYGMSSAQAAVERAGAKIALDKKTQQNYAQWKEGDATYKIWLEDETALEAKLQLMKQNKLAGVAAWRLGFEKKGIWDLILKYVN